MRSVLYIFALAVTLCSSALAGEAALITKESKLGVKETIDALTAALAIKGVKVVARIDHATAAKAAGLELRPTEVILFGNPTLGTPLMQADQRAGLDLPMKVLAWQNENGKVFITYADPASLKAQYRLDGKDEVLKAMTQALDVFTTASTSR